MATHRMRLPTALIPTHTHRLMASLRRGRSSGGRNPSGKSLNTATWQPSSSNTYQTTLSALGRGGGPASVAADAAPRPDLLVTLPRRDGQLHKATPIHATPTQSHRRRPQLLLQPQRHAGTYRPAAGWGTVKGTPASIDGLSVGPCTIGFPTPARRFRTPASVTVVVAAVKMLRRGPRLSVPAPAPAPEPAPAPAPAPAPVPSPAAASSGKQKWPAGTTRCRVLSSSLMRITSVSAQPWYTRGRPLSEQG